MDAAQLDQAIAELYPAAKIYHEQKAIRLQHPQSVKLAVISKNLWNESLNISCGSCLAKALNRLYQFQSLREKIKAPEVKKVEMPNDYNLTLSELRAKYPNIKSTSKLGFMEKLKEQESIKGDLKNDIPKMVLTTDGEITKVNLG